MKTVLIVNTLNTYSMSGKVFGVLCLTTHT